MISLSYVFHDKKKVVSVIHKKKKNHGIGIRYHLITSHPIRHYDCIKASPITYKTYQICNGLVLFITDESLEPP